MKVSADECVGRVASKAGITEEEARAAVEEMRAIRDEEILKLPHNRLELELRRQAIEGGDAEVKRAVRARRQALIQAEKLRSFNGEVELRRARESAGGRNVRLDKVIRDEVYSIGHNAKALFSKAAARLVEAARLDKTLEPLMRGDKDFNREIIKERGEPGASRDERVKKLAAMMNETEQDILKALNDAGAEIKELADYGGHHKHHTGKIASNVPRWEELLRETVDWPRTIKADEPDQRTLDVIRSHILKGTELIFEPESGLRPRPLRRAPKPLEHKRIIHFKDADAWVKYNGEFGEDGVWGAFMDRLELATSRLAQMERLGPKPEGTLNRVIEYQKNQLKKVESGTAPHTLEALERLNRQNLADGSGEIGRAWRAVSDADRIPENLTIARIGSALRQVMTMSKLGSALMSQLSDVPTMVMQAKVKFGYSLFEAWGETLGAFWGGIPPEMRQEFAGLIDVFNDSVKGRLAARFDGAWSQPGLATRLTEIFMKGSGMTLWSDNLRAGATAMISHALGRVADKSLAKLGPEMAYLLKSHGLDKHWDIIRQYGFYKHGDRAYIVPEKLKKIPDQVIDGLIGEELAKVREMGALHGLDPAPVIERLRRQTREKLDLDLHTLFAAEADNLVVTPDARSRAALTRGTKPGSLLGEGVRSVMQFKSFSVAYFQKVLMPIVMGRPGQEFFSMGRLGNLALLIAQTSAFGFVSLNAKRLVKGEKPTWMDEEALSPGRLWSVGSAAFLQGGGAGLYGDFMLAERSRFGGGAVEALAGPLLGTLGDMDRLRGLAMNPEESLRGADILNFGINNTPFVNLWYTRAALDYAVLFSAREALSPGWLRRRENSMRRNGGREYIFPPSRYRARPFE